VSFLLIQTILDPFKIKVIRAFNGDEAIQTLNTNPDISLILMDIKMPVMNGLEATTNIRRMNNPTPIIALTTYTLPGNN